MHDLYKPFAWIAGRIISCHPALRDAFRETDFKGKLLVSGFVKLPSANGIHSCNGLTFDLDFTDGIQRDVYLGTYERRERHFLRRYVAKGWTCVDIGANVGFYTVHLAKAVGPEGRVYAIEASPANFQRLTRNVGLNAFGNCHLTQAAITSKNGMVQFHTSPSVNSGWGRIGSFASAAQVIDVPGVTFDTFVRQNELQHVDFLKIDIEGHELSFLEGAQCALTDGVVKRIMAEFCGYSLEPQGIFLKEYVAAFEKRGFVPTHFSMDAIAQANRGRYVPRKQILNLLFEHRSLERGPRHPMHGDIADGRLPE